MSELQLVKSKPFGTVECDFYEDSNKDILMTREQIGRALGYSDPKKAVANIHDKHRDRLNPLSGTLKLRTPGGIQEVVVYVARGVYEICRWSKQPKADEFVDFVWDTIEAIRKGYIGGIQIGTPTTSPGGVASLINVFRRIMREQGSSPTEICLMARNIGLAYAKKYF